MKKGARKSMNALYSVEGWDRVFDMIKSNRLDSVKELLSLMEHGLL